MIVINMAVRCDITSVVYAIWLGAFLVLGRQNSSIVWPVYVGFLAVLLPLQYLLVLGWPPALCLGENILVLISFHKALVKRNLKGAVSGGFCSRCAKTLLKLRLNQCLRSKHKMLLEHQGGYRKDRKP